MPLATGTRLGPYEVVALLGAGGMGEVYRATDTRLNRTVAIKILPPHISANPEMKQRFEREAQTIAGLNHPHICTLHDVGRQDGVDYLVMECLEGETLAARLERGPMPVAEAVRVASEVGDALDKAHRQGIVHRDFKPGNIMLTKSGSKLLDFGLAKLRSPESPTPVSVSAMPTNAKELTMAGSILGTLQYMAPEQLEGKEADERTDVFAFGATVYEMLTGRKAFQGKTQVSLMASILEHEPPPMLSLQPILPAALDALVHGCLAKDPDERWQSIRDVVRQLKQISERPVDAPAVSTAPSGVRRRERLIWGALAGVLAVIAVALGARAVFRQDAPLPVVRFEVSPPAGGVWTGAPPRFSVSPDGKYLVFAAFLGADKTERLWIRRLDSPDAKPIAGTESIQGALAPQSPFWSSDSRSIGFFVQSEARDAGTSKLKKVDVQGGPVQALCELPANNAGASWNADGMILVSTQGTNGIQRVPASGGVPVQVTTLDNAQKEIAHLWPQFLPDGRHFLYQAQTAERAQWAIYAGSLDSSNRKMLVRSEYAQFAAPNFLLYARGDALLAQRLDLGKFELIGEPVLVAESLMRLVSNGRVGFSVSNLGVLVYSSSPAVQTTPAGNRQLVWSDRAGKMSAPIGAPVSATALKLSPDAKLVALAESLSGTALDLWVYDINRGLKTRLTTDPAADSNPVWSPDGSRLVFSSNRDGKGISLYEKPVSGAVPERLLLEAEQGVNLIPLDISLDETFLVFTKGRGASRDLWMLPLSGDRKPVPYLATPFDEGGAMLSPNGRWLAYVSNESGLYQVVVQPFPDPSKGKWQISIGGGLGPRWKRDGRELYYFDATGRIVAVPVSTDSAFQFGKAAPLFEVPFPVAASLTSSLPYDVAADGQRFLLSVPLNRVASAPPTPLTVTLNWTAAIK